MIVARSLFPDYEKFVAERKKNQLPVAIYIRCDYISETKNNDDREKAIEENILQQEKMIRKYCADKDYNVVKVYSDRPQVDWENFGMINDGVRNMVKDSFDGEFCRVVLCDIFEMDTFINHIAYSLGIISDNDITIETVKQGYFLENFDFSVELVKCNKKIEEEKDEN